jgi:UDP-GlcNAc:undecaprenyl-phosphate/decaprenyl-phosphate GlcNAc-1-phosphate transferase
MIELSNYFLTLININLIFLVFLLLITFKALIFFWNTKLIDKLSFKRYEGDQRVHIGEVSRLGGVIIYLWFFLVLINQINDQTGEIYHNYIKFLIMIFPMMIISFIEDTYSNVSVKYRFFVMVITMIMLCSFWVTSFPVIEHIPFLSYLSENRYFSIIFYSFCLLALVNGSNFIDGMNGLFAFFVIGAIVSCIYLSLEIGSVNDANILILLLISVIIFIIFNFPFGEIFMGDTGAYLMGLFLGVWVINFFGTYDSLSSWNAVLILFYPIIEVIYSVVRKVIQKKSPFYPDRYHLHLKIYKKLNKFFITPKVANAFTTLVLSVFWLSPPILLPFVMYSQSAIFLTISVLTLTYLGLSFYIDDDK